MTITPRYRYLGTLTACFSVILILSNITSAKLINFFGNPLDAGIIIFPFSYILGDVLSEVYGYRASRQVIWTGFALLLLSIGIIYLATCLPPAPHWRGQTAFEQVFGLVPRISFASLIAYLCGELTNSLVLVKLKTATKGRHSWLRFIVSTICGEAIDTTLFLVIAFGGVWSPDQLWGAWKTGYMFKVVVEIPFLPLTQFVCSWFKRLEHE